MKKTGKVFISYRRSDSIAEAGRIYDKLSAAFGSKRIFKDVDSIPFGVDFKEYLDKSIANCDVVLVLIGHAWLTVKDAQGNHRLDDPNDFVRIEVALALKRNILVIPVLLNGVSMPAAEALPENMKPLALRNALQIRQDPDFHRDMARLTRTLKNHFVNARERVFLSAKFVAVTLAITTITLRIFVPMKVNSNRGSSKSSLSAIALNAILQKAKQLQESEQYDPALAQYDAAIAENPDSSEAYQERCYTLNQLQRYQEAIADCNQALSLDPNNARALWSKGYAFDLQEQLNEAIALYDQAIALDPNFAEAWNNKGAAQVRLGNLSAALQSLDKAIALKPDLTEAWITRGVALWDSGRRSEAVVSADRALELAPDSQEAAGLRQQMRNLGY